MERSNSIDQPTGEDILVLMIKKQQQQNKLIAVSTSKLSTSRNVWEELNVSLPELVGSYSSSGVSW